MEIILKNIHMICALLSITGFGARSFLKFNHSALLSQRWLRITPHIIDTLLLLSAILLVYVLHLNPLQQPWLLAKIIALVGYIFLGLVTLRIAKSTAVRVGSFIAALLVFVYIIAVAKTHLVIPLLVG
jgi:uncharacterized membrane protein SirB2